MITEIPGEYLSADMGAADLSGVALKWPYLLLIAAVIITLLFYVNIFYRTRKNK